MRRLFLLVFLGIFWAPSIQAAQKIVIAVDQGNPPFMFQQDGTASGIYPNLLSTIFDRMGVEVTVKAYPWKRALMMGEAGEVGIGGIYQTAKRLKIYDYSDPLYTEHIRIYTTPEKRFPFKTLSDLEGKTIGTLFGWSYGDVVDHFLQSGNVTVDAVTNDYSNFLKLIAGHVDCIFVLELTGKLLMEQEKFHGQVVVLENPVAKNDTYLVFAKRAHKRALLETFNVTLNAMKADGTYDKVIQTALTEE